MSKRAQKTAPDPLAALNNTPPPPLQTAPNQDESAEAQTFLDAPPMPAGPLQQPADDETPVTKRRTAKKKARKQARKQSTETEAQEPEAPPEEELTVFQWMRTYTAVQWQRIMCYVYRKRPIFEVDTSDGRPIYACKFSEPFEEDDLKRQLGSGKYQLRFNITPPQGGSSRNLRVADVYIFDLNFPPMLPAGPWLDNPRNAEWKGFRAAIEERELAEAAERRKRISNLDNPNQAAQQAEEEAMNQAQAELTTILRETQNRLADVSNPERQLKTLASLAEVLRPPQQPAAPPTDNGTKEILGILRDELKHAREQAAKNEARVFELLTKQQAPPPQKTFAEQAAEFGEIAKTLGFKRSGSNDEGSGSDAMWAGIFERAIEAAPDLIAAFMSRPATPKARTIDAQVEEVPADNAAATDNQPDEGESEAPGDPTLTAEDKELLTKYEDLLRNLVPNLIKGVKSGRHEEGYKLQRFFLDEFGKQALIGLREAFGAERMARIAYNDPTIKTVLSMPPNAVDQATVQAFLEEFFDYPRSKPATTDPAGVQ